MKLKFAQEIYLCVFYCLKIKNGVAFTFYSCYNTLWNNIVISGNTASFTKILVFLVDPLCLSQKGGIFCLREMIVTIDCWTI